MKGFWVPGIHVTPLMPPVGNLMNALPLCGAACPVRLFLPISYACFLRGKPSI